MRDVGTGGREALVPPLVIKRGLGGVRVSFAIYFCHDEGIEQKETRVYSKKTSQNEHESRAVALELCSEQKTWKEMVSAI